MRDWRSLEACTDFTRSISRIADPTNSKPRLHPADLDLFLGTDYLATVHKTSVALLTRAMANGNGTALPPDAILHRVLDVCGYPRSRRMRKPPENFNYATVEAVCGLLHSRGAWVVADEAVNLPSREGLTRSTTIFAPAGKTVTGRIGEKVIKATASYPLEIALERVGGGHLGGFAVEALTTSAEVCRLEWIVAVFLSQHPINIQLQRF